MCNISESVFYHRTGEGKLSAKGICQFPAHFHILFSPDTTACYYQNILFLKALYLINDPG